MADVLDRVRKLVALAAGNENRGEAANAAIKACELIKQHGLQLSEKQDLPPRNSVPWSSSGGTWSNVPNAKAPGWADFEEMLRKVQMEEAFRRARERAQAAETERSRYTWEGPNVDWGSAAAQSDAFYRNVNREHVDFTVRVGQGTLHAKIREAKSPSELLAFEEAEHVFTYLWQTMAYRIVDQGFLREFEAELVRRLGEVGKRHGIWFRVRMRG